LRWFFGLSLGCGLLLSACSSVSELQDKQEETVRSSGIVVKLVTFYIPIGPGVGNGRQFEYKPTEDERIPPDPINADYPFPPK
jgi:hypothetical protein